MFLTSLHSPQHQQQQKYIIFIFILGKLFILILCHQAIDQMASFNFTCLCCWLGHYPATQLKDTCVVLMTVFIRANMDETQQKISNVECVPISFSLCKYIFCFSRVVLFGLSVCDSVNWLPGVCSPSKQQQQHNNKNTTTTKFSWTGRSFCSSSFTSVFFCLLAGINGTQHNTTIIVSVARALAVNAAAGACRMRTTHTFSDNHFKL